MRCTVLASGSKGNCTLIEENGSAILIDAGLSAKECLLRMERTGSDPAAIGAILVTHEHTDHLRGVDVLARKLDVTVYATEGTLREFLGYRKIAARPVQTSTCRYDEPFDAAGFSVLPFATSHDAQEPCGYIVEAGGLRIGYCTDTGILTPPMLALLARCDGIVLESNHCPQMLATGPYPESLKRRIRSARGHLSNPAAGDCLRSLGRDVPQVILAHLSEVNNTPEKALAGARDALGLFFEEKTLVVATQAGPAPGRVCGIRL